MQDKSSSDGSTILFTLMLGLIVSGGISIASNAIGSKDAAIATQQKQIEALEQRLTQSEARFQGFVEGRR
jgi:starvation-inducible outer membrane lipoprotein